MSEQSCITIDLPGKFDGFLEGTSEIAGENGKTPLYVAYKAARYIRRGKGHTVRLSFSADDVESVREALLVLREYAESCIDCNQDLLSDPDTRGEVAGEVAGAKVVITRVDNLLANLPAVVEPEQPNTKTAAEVIATLSERQQELLLTWYVGSFDDARMPGIRLDAEVENLHTQVTSLWRGLIRS